MKKPYCGNDKPYILALFHESDRQKTMPVLEKLEKTGLELYGFDGKIRKFKAAKACAFVAFISEKFPENPERMEMLSFAGMKNIPVIAVQLDADVPQEMKAFMNGQEGSDRPENLTVVRAENLNTEELCAQILQADVLDPPAVTEQQRKCARIRFAVLSAVILGVIIAGVVSFGVRTQGWFSPQSKRLMLRSWMRGDLTILEQLLH